jgi:hypothetical protein
MLISDEYKKLGSLLHETDIEYGDGKPWLRHRVLETVKWSQSNSILDYGAGKCILAKSLPLLSIKSYDPCVPGIDNKPEPADLLVSCCVLEHVEPECLDDVLDDMRRCSLKAALIIVTTVPSSKILNDGRNAHLIINSIDWWMPYIMKRWKLHSATIIDRGFKCIVKV